MKSRLQLLLLTFFLSTNLHSQTINESVSSSKISDSQVEILNQSLREQDYPKFYETINTIPKKDDYIKYLTSKISEGHPPLYWLMADYYAINNNTKETHKWYYISIIMTQQDSSLCKDLSSRFATQKILKQFPEVLSVTRQTPQLIQPAMTDVIFFLNNIKIRTDPKWTCDFGNNSFMYPTNKTIPKSEWLEKRSIIFKKFTEQYLK